MIALADYSENVYRDEKRTEGNETVTDRYFRSDFIADTSDDIYDMNVSGSKYLNYPAGSTVMNLGGRTIYVLNARRNEYKEV